MTAPDTPPQVPLASAARRVLGPRVESLLSGDLPVIGKVILSVAWLALTVILAVHHEPWGDEADVWLAARDLDFGSTELRRFTASVGMPALWHLAVAALAKGGAPYWSMFLVHGALAGLVVGMLLWRSPLPPILRVLLPFSFFLGYEYSIVARSYVVTVLLLLVIAELSTRTGDRRLLARGLAIGLLANTNPHGFFIAFGLGVGLLLERPQRNRWTALALLASLALGALALYQLYPHGDGQVVPYDWTGRNRSIVVAVGDGFVPRVENWFPTVAQVHPQVFRLTCWLSLLLVLSTVLVALLSPGGTGPGVALSIALGGLAWIFAFKYYGAARHHGLFQMVLIWFYWSTSQVSLIPGSAVWRLRRAALLIWVAVLFLAVPSAIGMWHTELTRPFSGGHEAAEFINQRGVREGSVIAAHPPSHSVAVLPYLRTSRTYWPALDSFRSSLGWDKDYQRAQELPLRRFLELAVQKVPPGSLLMFAAPLQPQEACSYGLRLVFASTEPALHENYYIYVVGA